jgi:methylated-DNA-[protein]-cysteine S-methyltransferase
LTAKLRAGNNGVIVHGFRMKQSFAERCYAALQLVPPGRVTTYRALAEFLGTRAYRAVGTAMRRNPHAPEVPCHRVVKSSGQVGGFARGTEAKIKLLQAEGVRVSNGSIADFEEKFFDFSVITR